MTRKILSPRLRSEAVFVSFPGAHGPVQERDVEIGYQVLGRRVCLEENEKKTGLSGVW